MTRSGWARSPPPDVDDLPAELAQHAPPPGVVVLGGRRGVPPPALALDADLAHRVGEVELGEQVAEPVADELVDEADPRRGEDPPAMRWNQLRGSRASTRSPSSMSRAGGLAQARWRQAWATRRSSSGSAPRRRAPSSARAVGPMPTAGASRASVAAIDRTGMAVTSTTCARDVAARGARRYPAVGAGWRP